MAIVPMLSFHHNEAIEQVKRDGQFDTDCVSAFFLQGVGNVQRRGPRNQERDGGLPESTPGGLAAIRRARGHHEDEEKQTGIFEEGKNKLAYLKEVKTGWPI